LNNIHFTVYTARKLYGLGLMYSIL